MGTDRGTTIGAGGGAVRLVGCGEPCEQLLRAWSRCRIETDAPPMAEFVVPSVGDRIPDAYAERLASRVSELVIAAQAGRSVLLHAAGIARPDGRVLALAAESGGGKTTAASALCRRGWGYVTDDMLICGPELDVVAYPKPLSHVTDAHAKHLVGPDELGLGRAPEPLRMERVVILRRAPGVRPRLVPLDPGAALRALVEHACALLALRRPLSRLVALARRGVWALEYSEIEDAAALLAGDDWPDAPADTWEELPSTCPDAPGGGWACGVVDDAVGWGTGAAFLVSGSPVYVGALELALWLTLTDGRQPAELVAEAGADLTADETVEFERRVAQALALLAAARVVVAPGHRP